MFAPHAETPPPAALWWQQAVLSDRHLLELLCSKHPKLGRKLLRYGGPAFRQALLQQELWAGLLCGVSPEYDRRE